MTALPGHRQWGWQRSAGPASWSLALLLLVLHGGAASGATSDCGLREESIVASLSTQTIDVGPRFSGAKVLLFGAIDCPADVIVVVRGPRERVVVRQKTRIAGVWVNGASRAFDDVPEFYAVAATKPLNEALPLSTRQIHRIGVEQLLVSANGDSEPDTAAFGKALLHIRQGEQLYSAQPIEIALLGSRLFRGSIWFPAKVRAGNYLVDVYYVRDQTIIGTQGIPLSVERVGFESLVYNFAHRHPMGYGLTAIAVTALGGLSIGALLRKT